MFFMVLFFSIPILFEPFPISSSGHALLLTILMSKLDYFLPVIPAYYNYLLHGPIALVVLIFFWRTWLNILITSTLKELGIMIIAGFLADSLTVFFYCLFDFLGTTIFPLSFGFFITACLLFSLTYCQTKIVEQPFSIMAGLALGAAQGMALLPGISRFGATFVVARWLGFSSQKAFVFSFLIEWPISVAGFCKGIYELRQLSDTSELLNLTSCLVILLAMLGCYGGFCVAEQIVKKNSLWMFSSYMFAITLVSLLLNFF